MASKPITPIYRYIDGSYSFIGSGFFTTENLLVTAHHVVRNGGRFLNIHNQYVDIKLVFENYQKQCGPNSDDLAIFRLPSGTATQDFLPLASIIPSRGTGCHIMGFLPDDKEPQCPVFHNLKCSVRYEGGEGLDREYNKRLFHGWASDLFDGNLHSMSGGPILDENGQVVGMLIAGGPKQKGIEAPHIALPEIQLEAISSIHILNVMASL